MTLSISLLKRRAPSSGRGRPACGPRIGRRRRVVGLAAFVGRRHHHVSHTIYTASASYPPCPPSRGRGLPLEPFPPKSCFTGNDFLKGYNPADFFCETFSAIDSVWVKRLQRVMRNRYFHNLCITFLTLTPAITENVSQKKSAEL